jgi:hypothetical protein
VGLKRAPLNVTDGTERQIIPDMEANQYRPKIKYCSICDPFVFILREDETIGLFIGQPERGKVRRKDMSPMGEKVLFRVLLCVLPCPDGPLYRTLAILQAASTRIRRGCSRRRRKSLPK